MESEETQDDVKEAKSTEQEGMEERIFVPIAVSVRKSVCFVVTSSSARRPSATGSWLLMWLMKVMKHTRSTCFRSVSTSPCRQKGKNRCQVSGMREYVLQERNRVKRFREQQQGSPVREYLEHVKCCHDTDCNEPMMKKGFAALKMEIGKNIKTPSDEK